jgi:hypothetical protein
MNDTRRILVLTVKNHESKRKETHLVEKPVYCKVKTSKFLHSQHVVHSIEEITNCTNCLHVGSICFPKRAHLWSHRIQ